MEIIQNNVYFCITIILKVTMNKKKVIRLNDILSYHNRYGETKWAQNDKQKLDRLIERMSLLEKDEKSLIMKLTDNFCYIDFFDILCDLYKAFEFFLKSNARCSHIIFAPLKSPFLKLKKDKSGRCIVPNPKSPDVFYTIFKNAFIPAKYNFNGKIDFCDNPIQIKSSLKDTSKIILIDDFVGSGSTAVDAITSYLSYLQCEEVRVMSTQFSVLVIAAMNTGVDYIKSHISVDCYYHLLKYKGITENKELNTRNNIDLMKSIEKKVLPSLKPDFTFGYKKSESLICIMEKSPNNTFPFYWYSDSTTQLEPIFRRDI